MMKNLTTSIGIFLSLIILAGATAYISFWRGINQPAQQESEAVNFTVDEGESVSAIGEKLARSGLLRSSFYFDWYVTFKRIDKRIQAGEYMLNKNMNVKEIAKKLSLGDINSREKTIKIIEGWSIKDIAAYLEKERALKAADFIKLASPGTGTCFSFESCQTSFLHLIPEGSTLEGYLFPDTYRIFNDATAEDVIAKMLNNFELKVTPEMRLEIERQGKTLHEIIIMASIIEKEVPKPEDMKKIADIFYKRLAINMPLQSDATVNFITGKGTTRPSLDDLEADSPYNTYKNKGLTPGPISNPGLSAIEAAIYPEPNDYYYFLTAPEGEVIYSKTYEDHLREKYKYYN